MLRTLVLNGLCLFATVGIVLHPATVVAQPNPVVLENQQPGTSNWQIPWGSAGTDAGGQIKGYASATSVNSGDSVTFSVSTNPAQAYTIDVYRIGWYAGTGFKDGDSAPGLVGYEVDRWYTAYPSANAIQGTYMRCRTRPSRATRTRRITATHPSTRRRAEPGYSGPARWAGAGRWTISPDTTSSIRGSSR